MNNVALRTFSTKEEEMKKQFPYTYKQEIPDFSRVLTFDTETTADEFLNLKFGSFMVHENDVYQYAGLFWDDRHVSKKEYKVLKAYAEKYNIRLFSLEEFIKIFYLEIYERKTLCIGYNINFDLSRIILDYGHGRYSGKDGFSFKLTEDTTYPRLRIKHLTGRSYNVEFTRAKGKYRKERTFKGHFLDVANLACTLTDNKSLTLEKACEIFDTPIKKKSISKHGVITPNYIDYNITDVRSTYELFKKVSQEYERYQLAIPMTDIYSAASLGKQALNQFNIAPFMQHNNDFPPELIGNQMSGYYGGRCECKIRRTPTKVTVLDFFSMYPTVTLLLGLWDFVIADKIHHVDDTENVRQFIEEFTFEDALNRDIWEKLNVLVEIEPDDDILPVRTKYAGEDGTLNIGINHITMNESLYYFLPDILASKLLTGKTPKIKRAIRFIPEGIQESLTESEVYGVHVNPKEDNLIKVLVERRQEIKNEMKKVSKDSHDYDVLDAQQRALKILNNSTTYGIYIEMHPKEEEKLRVFSNVEFDSKGKYEQPGKYFNAIIGANITAGARLLLAIAEKFVMDKGEVHAYMDTDSIFVPPHLADELSHLFDSLNPYDFDKPILEIEDGMEDIWFYGISSKRYCLFREEGNKIIIPEGKKLFYKLHGLGHITNPFKRELEEGDQWHKKLWEDILRVHFHPEELPDVLEKYENYAVISKLAVSTGTILRRFERMNEGKPFDKQIKPFNFMLVGSGATINEDGEKVKPVAPYNNNPQVAIENEFIDYNTGDTLQGREYWKPLSDVFLDYINHPEAKFEGDIGVLQRRHLTPTGCVYIGKEANKVEMQELESNEVEIYHDIEKIREFVLGLKPDKAKEIGIEHRSALKQLKDRVREGDFNMNTKLMRMVIGKIYSR
ncbi:DNA polymerase [Methanolobus bombayensis]|uniref:DNA polymerase n=1 Tax=Methanolobus bombayensis TaxID=38023 RepID=UPI001AE2C48C|nr:DNA polymerase [Methanolobus bombayensis]MBP1908253.1 F0F1-type ATP synthase membrane subunit b/b' [Methanolobus bombayensis]